MSVAAASWGPVDTTCPRCGRPWQKWAGSKLPCHMKCYFTDEEQDGLLRALEESNGKLSAQRIADDAGLPVSWIRAALTFARERRAKRRA